MASEKLTGTLITLGIVGAAAFAAYEWLKSQCSTPGSTLYGDFACNAFGFPSATPSSLSQPVGPAVAAATTAVLSNVSRPGQALAAGDTFQLIVMGTPNSTVTGTAQQNSSPSSTSTFGSTDATGRKVITGTYGPGDAGVWTESWQVGSLTPAALSFSILPAPALSGLAGNRIGIGWIHRGGWA